MYLSLQTMIEINSCYQKYSSKSRESECGWDLPEYSGKQMVSGERTIFSSNKSFLFRNKMIEVATNHFELHIESNSFIDSIIRFISSSSANTKSYPDNATQNMMAVTPSKQWIHFFRSDRWPPTSNILNWDKWKLFVTPVFNVMGMWHSLEMKSFKTEMRLNDSSCLDSCSQHILLCRNVVRMWYPI